MQEEQGRILVVDDYHDLREILRIRISELGYNCKSAASGREALELAATFRPNIVILEWYLHDGSGAGLSKKLRDCVRHHGYRLWIFIFSVIREPSGFRAEEDIDEYLTKSTNVSKIEKLIAQCLLQH